jgi:hypothetical protein
MAAALTHRHLTLEFKSVLRIPQEKATESGFRSNYFLIEKKIPWEISSFSNTSTVTVCNLGFRQRTADMVRYRTVRAVGRVNLEAHKKIEEKTLADLSAIRRTVLLVHPKKSKSTYVRLIPSLYFKL